MVAPSFAKRKDALLRNMAATFRRSRDWREPFVNTTQVAPDDEPRSRTLQARWRFLGRKKKIVDVLFTLESEVLADGWRAVPVRVSYENARKRWPRTSIGGNGRAFLSADDYADRLLNHCGRIYSLEAAHEATIGRFGFQGGVSWSRSDQLGRPA